MSNQSLFVDLGSCTSRIFEGDRSVFIEPSCVITRQDQIYAIGQKAYDLLGKEPKSHHLYFPIEHGRIANTQACEWLLSAISENKVKTPWWQKWLKTPHYAAISANASNVDRERLKSTLSLVWGGDWKLINRSQAVLRAINKKPQISTITLIIDVGGNVTELSLFVGEELVRSDQIDWGGVMLTELVQRQIWSIYQSAISWQTAEHIKRELSLLPTKGSEVRGKLAVRGKHVVNQLGETTIVEAIQLRPAFEKAVLELVEQIQQFFAQIPTDLSGSVLESGVILSGGGSLLLGLEQRLATELKCPVHTTPSPLVDAIFGLRMMASL